ncbi:MAG: hypothetical protein L0229_07715 [Blastocatellia bacterium]|nr:hypothetical protein [Blastocatellia bacterium]
MIFKERFTPKYWRFAVFSILLIPISIWLAPPGSTFDQDRLPPLPDMALEIGLPTGARRMSGGGMQLILRRSLTVTDPSAAGDFTAIDVWAQKEGRFVRVKLSLIYNDLSNQEWWKDKKDRIVGTYLVSEGRPVIPSELWQYGIEPFELKIISSRPVTLRPGEDFRVVNNTSSLEVVSIEKSFDHCRLTLKNVSDKNIIAYYISSGRSGLGSRAAYAGTGGALIPAGESFPDLYLTCSSIEKDGLTILAVIFDDGTFEGDRKIATDFSAEREGVRLQAPHVLRMIEQALSASDDEMEKAFYKLEADLWQIPEAIDKPSALLLLKTMFPHFADEQLSPLYERLKGGLYEARNMALSPLGDLKRTQEEKSKRADGSGVDEAEGKYIRQRLIYIKETFEKMISRLQ